ncbi:MAG: hypothetical protein HOV80_12565 [Polyangiaceae bacterium]|nr:hypothetical protein [Polyangiaceae bacterium]
MKLPYLPRVFAFAFAASTLACPSTSSQPTEPTAPVVAGPVEAPPQGRLPETVVPQSYVLELDVDPSKETFSGTVQIALDLKEARRRIFLHGRDIQVKSAKLDHKGTKLALAATALPESGMLQLESASTIEAGPATIEIAFEAPFAKSLSGLYRVKSGGTDYAFTQMEPLDARRAFPCFDEPSFKVPFSVSLVVREGDKAIANTRATGESPAGPGKKRVTFAKSEKLPTYLVAFAVGPFDIVDAPPIPANDARKTPLPLRGIAAKGKGANLGFALERHAALVTELERYFGIAYPYDKLDIIAVPDFGPGAMENAGAITYREQLLIVDPKTATEAQRRDVVGVAAHELAHQWFGDLVTMKWWDDIWLNEAFATWMGQRAVSKVHPEWAADLESLSWSQDAMEIDSLASARSIRQKILTDDDVENAFDPLTYSKGGALLAMYERFYGEEPFRAGVRRYLEKHRFGNADVNDFLGAVFENKPELVASFRGFLDRPGVPSLEVHMTCDKGKKGLTTIDAPRYVPLGSGAEKNVSFAVPLCVRGKGIDPVCKLVDKNVDGGNVVMAPAECPKWFLPNAGGAAYARYVPEPAALAALVDNGFAELTPTERLSLFDSVRAGIYAGKLGTADVIKLLPKLAADPTREVAFAPMDLIYVLREDLAPAADRTKLEQAVVKAYGPLLKRLGWQAKPGEKPEVGLTRASVIEMLGDAGRDPAVRKEALTRAKAWLGVGGAQKPDALDADIRQVALVFAVQDGGKEVWDAAYAMLKSSDDGLIRRHLLRALGNATTDAEAERSRALVFDDALKQGEILRYMLTVGSASGQREKAWAWTKKEIGRIKTRVPEGSRGYVPFLARPLCDQKLIPEIRATFEPHLKDMLGAPRSLENAVEHVSICSAVKAKLAPTK